MNTQEIYNVQQQFFASGKTLPYKFRRQQLRLLKTAIKKREKDILAALKADLHKHPVEAYSSEIGTLYVEIRHLLSNLKDWMKPEKVTSPFVMYPSKSRIYRVPLGQVFIIAPWNYPFLLVMAPLVGAIAGGNCAVVKPSELAPRTSAVIAALIKDTFDPAYVTTIEGDGSTVIPDMMQHRFDHVFFTGGPGIGRKIMEMATPHLTPVTLELGGKSPCIVDETANIGVAAKRIVWGKFWNAGQTCIAPDYILVHAKVKDELIAAMKKAIVRFFGENPAGSPDYARIINDNRFQTLKNYLSQGQIAHGGATDEGSLYIAPTLLDGVSWNNSVMQDEIFGPILPVVSFTTLEEAVRPVKKQPYPLSLYLFTNKAATEKLIIEQLRFGGGCINNTLGHFTNPELPFGGVGNSGMGQYHGKYSFDTFTHPKSIMKTGTWIDIAMKYPPFKNKLGLIRWILK
ncbi:aldehyde dehydrogenase [Chitinophaga rhizophila]|uniref:Aldehyde dehydrogenase n=1 Tax=Chitinophaga rhizophila TaxID=2866212 RepID=A0ABS7GER1_9BACT|nr:aldehyde dehydrogenase [Chitinophaga rhizophila]MBW8685816.1 aldehyde dehydrogenase [Chitinophaga rhizophila]